MWLLLVFDFRMFAEINQSVKIVDNACGIVYIWEMKQQWTGARRFNAWQ